MGVSSAKKRSGTVLAHKKIVPSKTKRLSVGSVLVVGELPIGTEDGIVMRYDGNYVVVGGIPQTGGPWLLGVYPNGTTVWINGANL